MGRRSLAQRQVTDVNASQSGDIAGAVAQTTLGFADLKRKHEIIKMNDYIADINIQAMQEFETWKNKNTDDPFNEEKLQELDGVYDGLFEKYDEKISMVGRGDWLSAKKKIKQKYKNSHAVWGQEQIKVNAQNSINKGMINANKQAYMLGQKGDIDLAKETFQEQAVLLFEGVSGLLPNDYINETMDNFESDYMKQYVAGVIERSPEEAEGLLKDEGVLESIGSKEGVETLEKMIDKRKKELITISDAEQYDNHRSFSNFQLQNNVGSQLAELDRGVGTGEYDSKWAKAKKDSILSSKGIDAEIQFEFEHEIIMGISDTKEQYKNDKKKKKKTSQEYLRSIRDLEIKISEGISKGFLDKKTGEKLISSLYTRELSQATKNSIGGMSLGFQVNDAHDYFKDNLNGEDLFIATREFFYKTDGEDMSSAEKENLAVEISNNIKRSKLLSIIEQGELQEFNSIEEADNSGLPEGTIVTVGGRRYQI